MLFRRSPRVAGLLLLAVGVLVATGLVAQGGPRDDDSKTTELVAQMVGKYHVSQQKLDDEHAKKLFKKYLSDLDPMKLYFLQSDVDEFARFETQLDDMAREGNVSFAYAVFDRYLKRLHERIATVQRLVDGDFDFTKDESIATDAKELPWAKSAEEVNERWRKRIKYDVLSLKLEDETKDKKKTEGIAPPEAAPRTKRPRSHASATDCTSGIKTWNWSPARPTTRRSWNCSCRR